MQAIRLALRVRIPRPKVGKRLAKRDIFQTQGEGILAKGEILVPHFSVFAPRHRGQSRSIMPFGHDTGDSPRCHGLRARRQCVCGTVGRGILRAESAQILAKGEIPVIRFSLAFAAKPPESGSRILLVDKEKAKYCYLTFSLIISFFGDIFSPKRLTSARTTIKTSTICFY